MKLLIAVPTFETISPETFKSIWDVRYPSWFARDTEIDFEFVKGYDCARARNEIGKMVIDRGYDYVLMVDSDVIIPPNTLESFFEHPADMPDLVMGVIPKKNTVTHKTDIFSFNTENFSDANRYGYQELNQMHEQGIKKILIKGGGMGCSLIKGEIFNKMPYPWFCYMAYPNGGFLSEDLYFCDRMNTRMYKIVLDLNVHCGHLVRKFQYD